MTALPKFLIVGGPDVDARLELMHSLKDDFDVSAFGSLASLREKFLGEGFDYINYPLARAVNPLLDLFTLGKLFLVFRRLQPQVVLTFDTKPSVWGRLAARLAGVPVVIGALPGLGSLYVNDNFTRRILRSIYQWLQRITCHLSDLTIFQNVDDANQFIAAGIVSPQKACVIPGSGVNTQSYASAQVPHEKRAELRSELGFRLDEIVVTMVSRVIRSKGVFEFMAAAMHISNHFPGVRFLLVGPVDNESMDRLNAEEFAHLKQAVIWPGPRNDIATVLASSDIFVLPSAYREGIPRVLLEAASMGLPIVTTDSPGCKDVVENDVNGFLVPVRDAVALSQAILCLVERPDLRQRFGQVSRQRAVERFDLSVIALQIFIACRQILTRRGLSTNVELGRET